MIRLSLVLGVLFLLPQTTIDANADLTVGFETNEIVVSGVTPGGKIVVASIDRLPPRLVLSTTAVWTDSDNDGEITIEVADGYSDRAVYAVVDVRSGDYVVANPLGEAAASALRAQVQTNAQGELDRFVSDETSVHALAVRPGQGAWSLRGADGGTSDADEVQDGDFEIALETMEPLSGFAAAPRLFAANDLIIVMNPRTLEVTVSAVGQ